MRYYISDCHFMHGKIEDIDHRGFASLFEMHEFMIEQWNKRVTEEDEVYVLGDFCWGNGSSTWGIYSRLHGKITLIEGNHDYWYLDDPEFVDTIVEDVYSYKEVNDDGRLVVVSHYPIPFYNHQFDTDHITGAPATYMLHGHVHNMYDEYMLHRLIRTASSTKRLAAYQQETTTPMHIINCFCAFSNYTPLTLDEWIELDEKRRSYVDAFEAQHGGFIQSQDWEELNTQIIDLCKNTWNNR